MDEILARNLGVGTVIPCGGRSGGCISTGRAFYVGDEKVFVKENKKSGARLMFDGEYAGLHEIYQTGIVKIPRPIKVFEESGTSFLVTEYFDMDTLNQQAKTLGQQLAQLHLHNQYMKESACKNVKFVGRSTKFEGKFGFHTTTCCGFIAMDNTWKTNWLEFFAQNRLKVQVDLLEKNYGDKEARSLWPLVERNLSKVLPAEGSITPSLLHGDLWGGNVGEVGASPCIFDPAAFFGHSEYDLAISHMFGGFPSNFFEAYHELLPQQEGFSARQKVYQLFHYLNHWNHFGSSYKSQSISLMKKIANYQ